MQGDRGASRRRAGARATERRPGVDVAGKKTGGWCGAILLSTTGGQRNGPGGEVLIPGWGEAQDRVAFGRPLRDSQVDRIFRGGADRERAERRRGRPWRSVRWGHPMSAINVRRTLAPKVPVVTSGPPGHP
jgi:hypothetical protein